MADDLEAHDMRTSPIGRRHRPSTDEFIREHLETSTPVVLTGVIDAWPARSLWTLDFFRAHFGEIQVALRASDKEADVFFGDVGLRQVVLKEYFDLIEQPRPGERPPYLGNLSFNNPLARPLLAPLESQFTFPPYFRGLPEQDVRLWIGAAGQTSTIHNDSYHNLNAQVRGRKTFLLFAPEQHPYLYVEQHTPHCWVSRLDPLKPDLHAFPRFKEAAAIEVSLAEGEILFIPKFWWHHVRSETVAINLNVWGYALDEPLWSQDLQTVTRA
jgi:jumonji domain-containing protein 7